MTAGLPPRPSMGCDEARPLLTELALDILPGDQRAAALTHVEECDSCQAELAGLIAAGDALVSLTPAVEPPHGFEERVRAALPAGTGGIGRRSLRSRESRASRRSRRSRGSSARPARRAWVAVAAAVTVVAAGFGGWALGPGSPTPGRHIPLAAPGPLIEATLTAHGTTVGRVYAYWDNPGWVYMSLDEPGFSGRVTCQLVRVGGATTDIGWFTVYEGTGSWGAPLAFDPSTVRQARLIDDHGNVIASARL